MHLARLEDLKPAPEQAVIINVGTKLVTTLALLSALRHAAMPVLLIDCELGDGSLDHFSRFMESHPFDLLSAPLQTHGLTLDWLFTSIPAHKVLLIDSDLEIVNPSIVAFMREYIDDEETFGCGFVNGPGWLTDYVGTALESGYYQERPWMPLTMLKVGFVREAIRAGFSFREHIIWNEFAPSAFLSKALAWARLRLPLLRRWNIQGPRLFRRTFNGQRPLLVYCDTGADIYQHLRYDRGLCFVGFPERFHRRFVTHFFGVTRNTLNSDDTHGGGGLSAVSPQVRQRLQEAYEYNPPE